MFTLFWQAHRSSHSAARKHSNVPSVPPPFSPLYFSSVGHHLSAEAPSADRYLCKHPGQSAARAEVPQRPPQESDGTAGCRRRGWERGREAFRPGELRQPGIREEGEPKRSENEPSLPSSQQRLGSLPARAQREELTSPEEVSTKPARFEIHCCFMLGRRGKKQCTTTLLLHCEYFFFRLYFRLLPTFV